MHFWSLEQDKIIRRLHPDIGAIRRALPGRSEQAIRKRIRRLGMPIRTRSWTSDRNSVLMQLAPKLSDIEIAQCLGSTRIAVACQRRRLGLLRNGRAKRDKIKLQIVSDIRNEAVRQGITLKSLVKPAYAGIFCPSASLSKISWRTVATAVDVLAGDLYVEWDN